MIPFVSLCMQSSQRSVLLCMTLPNIAETARGSSGASEGIDLRAISTQGKALSTSEQQLVRSMQWLIIALTVYPKTPKI